MISASCPCVWAEEPVKVMRQTAEALGSARKCEQHHFLPRLTPAAAFRLRVTPASATFISGLATVTTWHPSSFHCLYFNPGRVANSTDSHFALPACSLGRVRLWQILPSYRAVKCHLNCEATPLLSQAVSLPKSHSQVACLSDCLWEGVPT